MTEPPREYPDPSEIRWLTDARPLAGAMDAMTDHGVDRTTVVFLLCESSTPGKTLDQLDVDNPDDYFKFVMPAFVARTLAEGLLEAADRAERGDV